VERLGTSTWRDSGCHRPKPPSTYFESVTGSFEEVLIRATQSATSPLTGFYAIKDIISAPTKPAKSREYRSSHPASPLSLRNRKFADSLLEESGFELLVPMRMSRFTRPHLRLKVELAADSAL
jgi:hypothetical protein